MNKNYAIVNENNIKLVKGHPGWLDGNGRPACDELLIENNCYPVKNPDVKIDERYQYLQFNHPDSWLLDREEQVVVPSFSIVEQPVEQTLLQAYTEAKMRINANLNKVLGEGFEFTIEKEDVKTTHHIQIRPQDKINLISLRLEAQAEIGNENYLIEFRTGENEIIYLSPSEFIRLTNQALELTKDLTRKNWDKKDQLKQYIDNARVNIETLHLGSILDKIEELSK